MEKENAGFRARIDSLSRGSLGNEALSRQLGDSALQCFSLQTREAFSESLHKAKICGSYASRNTSEQKLPVVSAPLTPTPTHSKEKPLNPRDVLIAEIVDTTPVPDFMKGEKWKLYRSTLINNATRLSTQSQQRIEQEVRSHVSRLQKVWEKAHKESNNPPQS